MRQRARRLYEKDHIEASEHIVCRYVKHERAGKELLSIGSGAVAGPNAAADAYCNITSGIGDASVRIDTLRAAAALAEAGQEDLGAATNGLICVINAYGTSAENASGLSDVFFFKHLTKAKDH
jgi:hypothetical protein